MSSLRVLIGDNRQTLQTVPAASVQAFVGSPPYYAVRDYETAALDFAPVTFRPAVGLPEITAPAWRGQIGLEPDPWHYVAHIVETYRAVRRVLRADGVIWVNLGDTYYTGAGSVGQSPGGGKQGERAKQSNGRGSHGDSPLHKNGATVSRYTTPNRMPIEGWKPKDLMGIPWMVAKALQADGWTLRSDVIWHKPNPMPSSQKDRPTSCHEHLFLFSASEDYFYDNEAIKEVATSDAPGRDTPSGWNTTKGDHRSLKGRHRPSREKGTFNGKTEAMAGQGRNAFRATRTMREKRDVWTIASKPYEGSHFATFPPDLVLPCVLSSTSARGACPECGAPWRRLVVQKKTAITAPPTEGHMELMPATTPAAEPRDFVVETVTTGWRPTCVCGSEPALKMRHDDLEEMETPTGEQEGECQALQKGRAAGRTSGENSGKRRITWWEHRRYAEQLAGLPKADRRWIAEHVATASGPRAFEHYMRTDRDGARPIPPELLESLITRGLLTRVVVPTWTYPAPVPCVVGDHFAGSGTVGEVALENGRHALLCELGEHYRALIEERTTVTPNLALE